MLGEYILQRGLKEPLHLRDCAIRYDLDTKKEDTLKNYFAKGYNTDEIPADELSYYLSADLHATQQLADAIYKKLNTPEYSELMNSVILTNKVCVTLAKIYKNGFKVDKDALDKVRVNLNKRSRTLRKD